LAQTDDAELQLGFDYMVVTTQFEYQLTAWKQRHTLLLNERATSARAKEDLRLLRYQRARISFDFHYSMLLVCSFGLQNALRRIPLDVGFYFNHCYSAATAVLRCAKTEYAGQGWLRHAPNSTFVCISYAAVSLLRFCRPQLQKLHSYYTNILAILDSTVDVLQKASASPTHLAAQYGQFLRAMISTQADGIATRFNTPLVRSPGRQPTGDIDLMPSADGFGLRRDWTGLPEDAGQPLPPQWSGIDASFGGTLDDLATSAFWDSVLLPGLDNFSHPMGES